MGEIWFSLGSTNAPCDYEQRWGKHIYRIENDGKQARVFVDGSLRYLSPLGRRLITTEDGELLRIRSIE